MKGDLTRKDGVVPVVETGHQSHLGSVFADDPDAQDVLDDKGRVRGGGHLVTARERKGLLDGVLRTDADG